MHFCEYVPKKVMNQYNDLRACNTSSEASKQYWIDTAKSLGFVDTRYGIQATGDSLFVQNCAHPEGELSGKISALPPATLSNSKIVSRKSEMSPLISNDKSLSFKDIEGGPLVDLKYKHLATDYLYVLLSQVQKCTFLESDRRSKRSYPAIGFSGLACRHCFSKHKRGRFFPPNIKTMSDTNKSLNVLHSHMLRCQQCPLRVKVGLQTLRMRYDEDRSKMKFGSQKAFFLCIWKIVHGERPADNTNTSSTKRQVTA